MPTLADPLPLPCGATLRNRLAKAAMSEQLADRDGSPGDALVRLYGRWAAGGAGLLVTGHAMVDRHHRAEAGNVIVDEAALDGMRRWASAATAGGTHAWLQLNHPGRQAPRIVDRAPVAPSPVSLEVGGAAFAPPRALTDAEIRGVLARFAEAARLAERAGFTGVELHGAHGYLVSQFLSAHTNRRDDAWGGDPPRRRRFLIEAVRAVRAVVAPGFAVAVKLNSADFQGDGFGGAEAIAVIEALGDERIDLLEISGGTYERPAMFDEPRAASTARREAFFLEFAERARAVARMPLMLTGGFRTRAAMDAALGSGAIDVVGVARPLAIEPELPAALLAGAGGAAAAPRLATGWRTLDSVVTGAWYQRQLRRMGRGLDPDRALTRRGALWAYLADAARRGPTPRTRSNPRETPR